MNLLLHGIGDEEHDSPIVVKDALKADPGDRFEMVLTNPPFGRKSSMTMVSDDGRGRREDLEIVRQDFWASTSNKQLNFVQHIKTMLDDQRPRRGGRARQRALRGRRGRDGAAQAAARVRRAHAAAPAHRHLLRAGREGERAVLRPQARGGDAVDARAVGLRPAHEQHFTLKQNPLRREHLDDFVDGLPAGRAARARVESERFKRFTYDELSRATRSASTSPGCATSRSRTWTTCPRPR